jgi:hypothetical protein
MTAAPGRAAGRWARRGDALSSRTPSGAVVLPVGGDTAVALSGLEQSVWVHVSEPVTVDALAPLADPTAVAAALERLAALGLVHEVA